LILGSGLPTRGHLERLLLAEKPPDELGVRALAELLNLG
jgi:hypothetical protein